MMKMKLRRLVDLRESKDWTQKQVADRLSISRSAYANYENGLRSIPVELLIELAQLYEVSLDYMVGLTDQKTPYPRKRK